MRQYITTPLEDTLLRSMVWSFYSPTYLKILFQNTRKHTPMINFNVNGLYYLYDKSPKIEKKLPFVLNLELASHN